MTCPIRGSIKRSSSPQIAEVIGKKRINIQAMIMNRSAWINSHGIGCKNQELEGTENAKK